MVKTRKYALFMRVGTFCILHKDEDNVEGAEWIGLSDMIAAVGARLRRG